MHKIQAKHCSLFKSYRSNTILGFSFSCVLAHIFTFQIFPLLVLHILSAAPGQCVGTHQQHVRKSVLSFLFPNFLVHGQNKFLKNSPLLPKSSQPPQKTIQTSDSQNFVDQEQCRHLKASEQSCSSTVK